MWVRLWTGWLACGTAWRRRLLPMAALATLLILGALIWWWGVAGAAWPDAGGLERRLAELRQLHAARPWAFAAGLFALFTVMSALALPGCSVLALAAGIMMGWLPGTLLVALASTVGATLSFLAARHWWRDAVQQRWGHRLAGVQAGLARDGAFYLLSLRLAPVIPYALLNPLMGLSAMPARQFFGVSLLGMLAGSAAYVYAGVYVGMHAGTALEQMQGWQGLFTPSLWAAGLLLAALPWLLRWLWRSVQRVVKRPEATGAGPQP